MSYKDTVLPVMRSLRDIVLPGWGAIPALGKKSAHPADVVTETDKKVEKFLREKLGELHPQIKFVGEEEGGDRNANKFWLVDPIDGTGHYMRGLPFSTSMLALIENGEVTFSAIYDFLNDDLYWAEKGGGAYKNEERICVSNRGYEEAYIVTETRMQKEYNQKFLADITKDCAYMRTVSAGWDFAMIACGKLEARVGFDPYGFDYDFSAGSLLVSEAGGVATNIGNDTYNFRDTNHIIGNKKVCAELASRLSGYQTPN